MFVQIAVVGRKHTGKTTAAEYLISTLSKNGFRVGAVKRIHDPDFSIDTPGKDTHRLSRAGAVITISSADKEIATLKQVKPSDKYHLDKITKDMKREGIQVVVLEGYHSVIANKRSVAKIIAAKNEHDLDEMLKAVKPPILAVTGVITKRCVKRASRLPIINLPSRGPELSKLVLEWIRMR